MDKKQLGAKLKQIRLERFGKQTYSDFARLTGVSKGSMQAIEDGRSYPLYDTLEKWVLGCGLTLQEFFVDDEKESRPHLYFSAKHREFYALLNRILERGTLKQVASLRIQLEAMAESVAPPAKTRTQT